MQRATLPKFNVTVLQYRLIKLTHLLSLLCLLAFATNIFAQQNVRGVEIEFLRDEPTVRSMYTAEPIQTPLILSSSPALTEQDDDLWSRIKAGYAMPDIASRHTERYEASFAARQAHLGRMMSRTKRYLHYVVEEVEKRGMPMEIALLPMIESAYNPIAKSRSKAVGIWQFMPATGQYFGLEQNWWVDQRQDVVASTKSALDYLEQLHETFGSWDLALAAYNAGPGTVSRAIKRNQKAGLMTDYQSLTLPLETTHYVPKLQAIKNIISNPTQYNVSIEPIPNTPYFTEVDAPDQMDADLVMKMAGISSTEFRLLNPSFKRPIVASKDDTHKVLLPTAAAEQFYQDLTNHNQPLVSWKVYRAKKGEHVAKIAKKFKISSRKLRAINGLTRDKKLNNSLRLLVPIGKSKVQKINIARLARQKVLKRSKSRRASHKIRSGDTLSALAKRYGTNTRTLMKINRLKTTKLKIGQIIRVKGKRIRARTKRM